MKNGDFDVTDSGIHRIINIHDNGTCDMETVLTKDAFLSAYRKWVLRCDDWNESAKQVFVSTPMDGKSDDEINEAIVNAMERLRKMPGMENVYLIQSVFKFDPPEGADPGLWYLGQSISLLASADGVVFTEGWDDARGCRSEYDCAKRYGKEIIVL